MAITKEQTQRAKKIDNWVQDVLNQGGNEEQILEGMYDYMPTFKQILDTASPGDIDQLCQQYDGFYRFAKLLELLAQGLASGTVTASGIPAKPKKKRPRKPKTKNQQPQLLRRTIEDIPLFTEAIMGITDSTDEQYANFMAVRQKPHVLDDEIVDRAKRAFEEQLTGIPNFRQQLNWILEDKLTDAQRYQVEDLLAKLPF